MQIRNSEVFLQATQTAQMEKKTNKKKPAGFFEPITAAKNPKNFKLNP